MRKTIDNLDSLTGWTPQAGSTLSAYAVNLNPEYIADNLTGSVIFKIPSGNLNKYITKTISVDITGYDEIVLWAWSRNKSGYIFDKSTDYSYKIDFGGTSYYIPVKSPMSMIVLGCSGMTELTRIRITALHDDEDYLLISSVVAVKEQNPYDAYIGLQSALRLEVASKYPDGIAIGTTSVNTGAKTMSVSSWHFLERYAVVKIKDTVNSEIHQIIGNDETNFSFGSLYAGKSILHDYTDANVYLQIPIEFGQDTVEIKLPSMCITGIVPELVRRGSALEDVWDTRKDDNTVQKRREGAIFKYRFLIDCEARHDEILGILSEITRKFLAKETVWINNKKYRMVWEGSPTEVQPTEAFDIVPKIQYLFSIEMIEGLYAREVAVKISDTNLTVINQ
jgi:hypothetical protein